MFAKTAAALVLLGGATAMVTGYAFNEETNVQAKLKYKRKKLGLRTKPQIDDYSLQFDGPHPTTSGSSSDNSESDLDEKCDNHPYISQKGPTIIRVDLTEKTLSHPCTGATLKWNPSHMLVECEQSRDGKFMRQTIRTENLSLVNEETGDVYDVFCDQITVKAVRANKKLSRVVHLLRVERYWMTHLNFTVFVQVIHRRCSDSGSSIGSSRKHDEIKSLKIDQDCDYVCSSKGGKAMMKRYFQPTMALQGSRNVVTRSLVIDWPTTPLSLLHLQFSESTTEGQMKTVHDETQFFLVQKNNYTTLKLEPGTYKLQPSVPIAQDVVKDHHVDIRVNLLKFISDAKSRGSFGNFGTVVNNEDHHDQVLHFLRFDHIESSSPDYNSVAFALVGWIGNDRASAIVCSDTHHMIHKVMSDTPEKMSIHFDSQAYTNKKFYLYTDGMMMGWNC